VGSVSRGGGPGRKSGVLPTLIKSFKGTESRTENRQGSETKRRKRERGTCSMGAILKRNSK